MLPKIPKTRKKETREEFTYNNVWVARLFLKLGCSSFSFIFTIIYQRNLVSGQLPSPYCRSINQKALECLGMTMEMLLYYPSISLDKIEALKFVDYNSTELNLTIIDDVFPNVINLTVSKGSLSKLVGTALNTTKLKVLKLNELPMKHIKERTLASLRQLRVLDLRNNSFGFLHKEKLEKLSHVATIYLSGNPFNCSHDLDWIFPSRRIKDLQDMMCRGEPFDKKPLVYVAELKHNTSLTCPELCSCSLTTVTLNSETNLLRPAVEVDCSNRNLTNFPENLPEHTTKLVLNHNSIQDLSPLIKNPVYDTVTDLFLNYNSISSIEILEGTNWLSNFRILSLKGNLLTEVPTYAMANAFRQNPNMPNAVMLFLSENPWKCNCMFTPSFQDKILVKYAPQIQDVARIKCAHVKGDPNSLLPIIQLSRAKICHTPAAYSEKALNLLNGVLAFLILFVFGKLAYDYYVFKTSGKLPWIVTKLP